MKSIATSIGAVVLGFVALGVILGLTWVVQGNEFFMYKYFAPKMEDVRRETFEHSKSYNQGMVQELQNMQFDYIQADEEHRDALASIILHRVADYDVEKLPADLRDFVQDLRRERSLAR